MIAIRLPTTAAECVAWLRSPEFPAPLEDVRGVEFIDGRLSFEMSPKHRHDAIAFAIAKLFDDGEHEGLAPCSLDLGDVVRHADAVQDPSYPTDDDVPTDARIIVEVVSTGHERDDSERKARLYLDRTTAIEFWLVTQGVDEASVDVLLRRDGVWRSAGNRSEALAGSVTVRRVRRRWVASCD